MLIIRVDIREENYPEIVKITCHYVPNYYLHYSEIVTKKMKKKEKSLEGVYSSSSTTNILFKRCKKGNLAYE